MQYSPLSMQVHSMSPPSAETLAPVSHDTGWWFPLLWRHFLLPASELVGNLSQGYSPRCILPDWARIRHHQIKWHTHHQQIQLFFTGSCWVKISSHCKSVYIAKFGICYFSLWDCNEIWIIAAVTIVPPALTAKHFRNSHHFFNIAILSVLCLKGAVKLIIEKWFGNEVHFHSD